MFPQATWLPPHSGQRSLLSALMTAVLTLVAASSASAHVTVNPTEVPPESFQVLTVRVPTEKENEATTRVRVEFPAGLTVSRFQPKSGWTRELERNAQGQITAVTWSGGRIEPGEFDEFAFQARMPKEAGALSFKAYQTYQGGETVEWVNAPGTDRPAAVVSVRAVSAAAGTATDDHDQAGGTAQTAGAGAPAAAGQGVSRRDAGSGSDLPLFAGLAAGVLALVALVVATVALNRRPRPA